MQRYYSKSTGCTYLEGINSDIPADAVPIDNDRYQSVIANPAPGKLRSHDEYGLPILIDPPPHVPTYQLELAELNVVWQQKVDGYNRAFAIASLVDGLSEEQKKQAIRAEYEAAKVQNTEDRAALKAKYGM